MISQVAKGQCTSMAQPGIQNFRTMWHQFEPISTFLYETERNLLLLRQKLIILFFIIKMNIKIVPLISGCRKDENYQPSKMVSMWVPLEAHLAPNLETRETKSKKKYIKGTYGYTWSILNNLINFDELDVYILWCTICLNYFHIVRFGQKYQTLDNFHLTLIVVIISVYFLIWKI